MINNLSKIIISFLFLTFFSQSMSFGQNPLNTKYKTLQDFGLSKYPSPEDLKNILFDENLINVTPLISDDINSDFSNINDLGWLNNVSKEIKVLLFGELHYFQYVTNLRNRIFFALNTFDYFPLIILEKEYSKTPYYNHYLSIQDDKIAAEYIDEIYNLFSNEAEFTLLQHIRRWNKSRPNKLLHVGCTDIEHDSESTINEILVPYFKRLDPSFKAIELESTDNNYVFARLDSLLHIAMKKQISGRYPFINYRYIKNVVLNLKSTFISYNSDREFYHRQKAIIRNLTDPNFLGDYLVKGKAMLYGGLNHTPTHSPPPDSNDILWEGTFLSQVFEPTIGKTYSISAIGLSFSLAAMKKIYLSSCLTQGSAYATILTQMQNAYFKGLLNPKKSYFTRNSTIQNDEFKKLIIKSAFQHNNAPVFLKEISWNKIDGKALEYSQETHNSIIDQKKFMNNYDAFIYVPQSPIIIARLQKGPKKKIIFHVTSKIFPDSMVFITGDHQGLGSWNPNSINLNKQNDGSWTKTFIFNEGTSISYKITRGSWDKEAVDKNGIIPQNLTLKVKNDSAIYMTIENWKDNIKPKSGG